MNLKARIARMEKATRANEPTVYTIWGLEEDGTYTRICNGQTTTGLTLADLEAQEGTIIKVVGGVSMAGL